MAEFTPKLPPYSLEAEKSVLGAMFLDERAAMLALSRLSPEDFYIEKHKNIFASMQEIAERSGPIDMVLVLERLKRLGYQEDDETLYLSDLTISVPSVSNVGRYMDIIEEKATLRRLVDASREIEKEAMKDADDAQAVVSRASDLIYQIAVKKDRDTLKHIRPAVVESYEQIDLTLNSKTGVLGLTTGFSLLDRKLSGLQGSQLIVIAGRPGMGKTSFALDIVRHVALSVKKTCAVFSLEMSAPQLTTRLICSVAQIDMQDIRNRTQNTGAVLGKLIEPMETIANAPIYIDDSPGLSVTEMLAKSRKLKIERELGIIMIDYLQLMGGNARAENRQLEISEITRSIKIAARELDVPILLLSQLSRASERRGGDRIPILSDLRESGSIEQDADVVIFLHRDNYYDETADNTSRIIIAKQRMGPTGTVNAKWIGSQTRFAEIDEFHEEG